MFGLFATALFLGFVYWLILGRPTRKADDRDARRRRGGRTAQDRSFWGMPARDRSYMPGLVLVAIACIQLAGIIETAGDLATPAFLLAAVVAMGFAIRPDIVAVGVGILGTLAALLTRFGATSCGDVASTSEQLWFFGLAGAFIAALAVTRLLLAPVESGTRAFRRPTSSRVWSIGPDRRIGPIGSFALVSAGVLDLLGVLVGPSGTALFSEGGAPQVIALVAFVVAAGIIGFGLATLPDYTLSMVGVLVVIGEVLAFSTDPEPCRDLGLVVVVALVLVVLNRVVRRVV